MKILITGGSGFIGTHVITDLLKVESTTKIDNVDVLESPVRHQRFKDFRGDIRSEESLMQIPLSKDYDICIHLAALCKEPGFAWDEYFETNHIGTKNVVDLCEKLGINNILFTSTMMVYQAGEVQRTEEAITAPDTAYGISKLLAEKELESWRSASSGRSLKIIRPAVVFGEGENANFTRLYKGLKKGFFPFIGKSSTVKSNIYVHELNSFIQFLMIRPTHLDVFNFGFPETQTMRQITDTFNEVFDFKPFSPTLPLGLMRFVARGFEFLNSIGIKNSIHPRRIEKLYYSTDIYPESALKVGYKFRYNLKTALEDWKISQDKNL